MRWLVSRFCFRLQRLRCATEDFMKAVPTRRIDHWEWSVNVDACVCLKHQDVCEMVAMILTCASSRAPRTQCQTNSRPLFTTSRQEPHLRFAGGYFELDLERLLLRWGLPCAEPAAAAIDSLPLSLHTSRAGREIFSPSKWPRTSRVEARRNCENRKFQKVPAFCLSKPSKSSGFSALLSTVAPLLSSATSLSLSASSTCAGVLSILLPSLSFA